MSTADDEWELIHACTRADLLRDGWLVDVRGWAREAGFQVPVAITASAWNEAVAWDDCDQDTAERRAREVLRAAARAALDLAESGRGTPIGCSSGRAVPRARPWG